MTTQERDRFILITWPKMLLLLAASFCWSLACTAYLANRVAVVSFDHSKITKEIENMSNANTAQDLAMAERLTVLRQRLDILEELEEANAKVIQELRSEMTTHEIKQKVINNQIDDKLQEKKDK